LEILIEEADSIKEYLEHWTKAMADVYWFTNPSLFDYVHEEIVEEITREFNQPNCMHLMAISQDSNEILGVLKVRTNEGIATLGRWEPAVPAKHREKNVGEALLEKVLEAAKDGKMGFSPPECWRVAKLKGNVAGFVIAFMPSKTKYQPAHGVIAELGVFPEYRRMGIAQLLITDAFKSIKRHGYRYALVGTPKTNTPALNLYTKQGFVPVFENVFLQKIL